METSKTLSRLAEMIRARYYAEYNRWESLRNGIESDHGSTPQPAWDGGTTSFGRRCKPVWPKVAEFCVKHGINPDHLIRSLFDLRVGGQVWPNELFSDRALEVYAKAHGRQRIDVRNVYRSEQLAAGLRFSEQRRRDQAASDEIVWRRVLTDPSADFSPLFIHCLACGVGAVGLAAKYRERAFWQYVRSPKAYDEAMGEVIPCDLREEAARVHESTQQ